MHEISPSIPQLTPGLGTLVKKMHFTWYNSLSLISPIYSPMSSFISLMRDPLSVLMPKLCPKQLTELVIQIDQLGLAKVGSPRPALAVQHKEPTIVGRLRDSDLESRKLPG